MSKYWIKPTQQAHWEHRYVAIFKCSPKEKGLTDIVVANDSDISKNSNLQRVLKALQTGMLSKREYPSATNPTIRYLTFRQYTDRAFNKVQQLLNELLKADTKERVYEQTLELSSRYMQIQNVQKGVLIFLISHIILENELTGSCLFVFKCDFEDISQLTTRQVFRRIEDAFEEQAKKGAQYPFFNGRTFDTAVVRVFDSAGETKYWLEFLELGERPAQYITLHSATLAELARVQPDVIDQYGQELQSPGTTRSLTADEHIIAPEDRLSTEKVKELIDALPDNLSERKVSLVLDGARITVPIKEYGRTWMVAEHAGMRYVLIKGFQLEIHTKMLTPFDVACLEDLGEALATLDIPLG
jgi:hypothetical protein